MAFGDIVPRRFRRETEEFPISSLQTQMNRLFNDFLGDWPIPAWSGTTSELTAFTPKMTLAEDAKQIVATFELPGMDEKDVDITLTKDGAIVRGHKKIEHEKKEGSSYYCERSEGEFERSLRFNCKVDEDRAEAIYKNGILTLTLPKTVEAQKEQKKLSIRKA